MHIKIVVSSYSIFKYFIIFIRFMLEINDLCCKQATIIQIAQICDHFYSFLISPTAIYILFLYMRASIDVEQAKQSQSRKRNKKIQSELLPRRTQLKIMRLDEQIMPNPVNANIINLQFGQQAPPIFKRVVKRMNRKPNNLIDDRKLGMTQRELYKNRYHDLFKDNIDYLTKNTMQIGPWAASIAKQTELNDIYSRRKLINIERLVYPLRQNKKQLQSKQKFRTLMSHTTRIEHSSQNLNVVEVNNSLQKHFTRQMSLKPLGVESQSQFDLNSFLMQKNDLKPEYKKEILTLIPIRKPSNKKEYFVFGLSDRSNICQNKIQIYRDLLWKINYSNSLYVNTPEFVQSPYKFYIGEGNNSNLIRGILRRRFWWTQASNKNQECINFVWTQLKMNSFFNVQENANLPQYFIFQREYSNQQRAESSAFIGQGELDNNQKIFGRIDYKIWRNHVIKNAKAESKLDEKTYQKRIKMYEKKKISKIDQSKSIKMHNHLQENYYIGNKKALFYNVKRYMELKGQNPFKMLPLTFHINKGVDDPQYGKFVEYYNSLEQQKIRGKKNTKNIWIVKPGQNTNRGNGITVCYNLDDIKIRLRGRERNSDGKLRTFILQKYIQNPMLYNKRKFDLRHYVLISCINGSFKAYWYEDGYVRTSSSEFNIKTTRDPLIHLTNDAIQKNTAEYGKYQKANKLSYAQLQKYFQTAYPSKNYNFYDTIIPKMKRFATEAVKATYFILDNKRSKHNFELLGLDFMIDEDFEPWLIQINTNPCLQLCCPHLQKIIPSLIENTFKICLDPLFPPPEAWPNNRKPFFSDDPLAENKFEIIFDETCDGKEVEKLFNGRDKVDIKMGKIEQDDEIFQNDGQLQWEKVE